MLPTLPILSAGPSVPAIAGPGRPVVTRCSGSNVATARRGRRRR